MADQNTALYDEIRTLLTSKDPAEQQLGVQATQKMTPEEHQAFSSYAERHRLDTGIGGVPIEAAVVGGLAAPAVGAGLKAAAMSPAGMGAIGGGAEGFMRKGWQGVIPGAIEGGITGGALSKVGLLKKVAGLMGAAAPAAAEAAPAAAPPLARLILTPAEQQAQQQLLSVAAKQASKVGMANAASGGIRQALLGLLGR